jgi:hypothetical protein
MASPFFAVHECGGGTESELVGVARAGPLQLALDHRPVGERPLLLCRYWRRVKAPFERHVVEAVGKRPGQQPRSSRAVQAIDDGRSPNR